jgi:hypothetical protein
MIRRAVVAAMLAGGGALVAFGGVAGGHSGVTTLRGTVGPGFTITLAKGGKRVTQLAPGTYRIVVADRSRRHNFKLEKSGGGPERVITSVPFVGVKTVTVRLTAGPWEYYCTPHKRTMKGRFAVGAAGSGTTTTTTGGTTTTEDEPDDGPYDGYGEGYE